MKIILSEDYFIRDSGMSYDLTLDYHRLNKKGKPEYKVLSFHSDLEKALNSYARLRASKELKGEYNPKDYVLEYNKIVLDIAKLTGGEVK